jgi:gas vesicle protein
MMNSGKVLTGILAGFAAGAVIGILFAPDKGSATRRKIADKSDDYTAELKAKYDELRDTVRGKYASAKQGVRDLAAKGKETLKEVSDEVDVMAWEAKNAAQQGHNS